MSKETAQFLLDLLGHQQLNVGAPDFEQVAGQVIAARSDLLAILNNGEA